MAVSKIEYFGETLIDLTNDTVSADTILAGYTAHGKDGEPITGTLEVEDVTEETAAYTTKLGTQDNIIEQIVTALQNKTGSSGETKEEQEKTVTPTMLGVVVTPDQGKTLSKVTVSGDSDLVASNIKKDVEIFGVTGTYEGGSSSNDLTKILIERSVSTLDIPDGITKIGSGTFYSWTTLTSVTLPTTVTSIGNNAFRNSTKLTSVSLTDSITSIGATAFYGCTKLTLTSLPNGITTIGNNAFYNCTSLTSLTFEGTPTTISTSAFSGCTNLTTINVPWASGAVANAPWGATNATINYNYTG